MAEDELPTISPRARCRCGHSYASHAQDRTQVLGGPGLAKGWCVMCGCHEFALAPPEDIKG